LNRSGVIKPSNLVPPVANNRLNLFSFQTAINGNAREQPANFDRENERNDNENASALVAWTSSLEIRENRENERNGACVCVGAVIVNDFASLFSSHYQLSTWFLSSIFLSLFFVLLSQLSFAHALACIWDENFFFHE
jgi:hypothetical protein